jgi:hypothetical protein
VTRIEDLDEELERLSGLAEDFRHGTHRWELVWDRIDLLLDERGKLSVEVFYDNDSLRCDRGECIHNASGTALWIHDRFRGGPVD